MTSNRAHPGGSPLFFEILERRILFNANPVVGVDVPDQAMLNEEFTYGVTFDNTGTPPDEVGYGPYVDVRLPAGVDAGSASVLGAPATPIQKVDNSFEPPNAPPAAQTFTHPLTGQPITVQPGEEYLVFELPFGSVVPAQPEIPLELTATLDKAEGAMEGTPLQIAVEGGFYLGTSPTGNGAIMSGPVTDQVTPIVLEVGKEVIAPEGETATGPNFPRTWRLTVDIADQETITDLEIADLLPDNVEFIPGSVSVTGGTPTALVEPLVPPSSNPAERTLQLEFASVTGTASDADLVIEYQIFVPEFDASGNPVLNPVTGAPALSENGVDANAQYDPDGVAGPLPAGPVQDTVSSPNQLPNTDTLTDRSIATQKQVALQDDVLAPGVGPFDTLEYTIRVQVSDYFQFDDLKVEDLLGDGQTFDSSMLPTLSWREEGVTTSGSLLPAEVSASAKDAQGVTTLEFDLSAAMVRLGGDAALIGDLVDGDLTTGTTLTLSFFAVIDPAFTGPTPSNPSLGSGDAILNNASVDGRLPSGNRQTDDTTSEIGVRFGEPDKTVYSVNSDPSDTSSFGPGDEVTFRFELPLAAKLDDLRLTDYLPLPKFEATELTTLTTYFVADPTAFVPTIQAGEVIVVMDSALFEAPPGAPFDFRQPIDPQLSVSGPSNSFTIDFGDLDQILGLASDLVVYATLTATDVDAADGLLLTNQLVETATDSNGNPFFRQDIVQVLVEDPELAIYKGVVGYEAVGLTIGGVTFNAPGSASPIDSGVVTSTTTAQAIDNRNLTGNLVDGQDLVRFAIVLENTGRTDAFDVVFKDQIPFGFDLAAPLTDTSLNLTVTDGALNPIAYQFTADDATRRFEIELSDPPVVLLPGAVPQGAINQGKLGDGTPITDGSNYILITYDLQLSDDVDSDARLTNTATLTNYVGEEGSSENRVPQGLEAEAFVRIKKPEIDKTLDGTSLNEANNAFLNEAVIGESAFYSVTVTVPEGQTKNARIVDQLDAGLEFVGLQSVIPNGIAVPAAVGDVAVSVNGQAITFDLGDLSNPDGDNSTVETVTLTYEVRVRNSFGNQDGTTLDNEARFRWTTTDQTTEELDSTDHNRSLNPVSADPVTVIEPLVTTQKDVTFPGGGPPDAGDLVEYTLTYTADNTRPIAYDVALTDPFPSEILNPVVTGVTDTDATLTAADFLIAGQLLQLQPASNVDMTPGRVITVTVQGTLSASLTPKQVVTNTAQAAWTSLDGDQPTIERTGVDGPGPDSSVLNNYVSEDPVSFTSKNVAIAKEIVSTSEPSTAGSDVTIGEVVRYRVTITLPEGTTPNFQVHDLLPEGLTFLDDGKSTYAALNTAALTSSTLGALPSIPGLPSIPANVAFFPDAAVGSSNSLTADPDTFSSGRDIFFKFGDLTNSDNDNATDEQIVIEFNALVDNDVDANGDAWNESGDSLENRARASKTGNSNLGTSPGVTIGVVEPELVISKTVTSPAIPILGAGDPLTYTLEITNNGTATAFDLVLTDPVPAALENLVVTSSVGTVNPAGNLITVSIDELAPAASATVTITGTLVAGVADGSVFTNTGTVTYTSLPGANGTPPADPAINGIVPGGPGSPLGERDGSNGIGGRPNDYITKDSAAFATLPVFLNKTFQGGTLTPDDTSENAPGDSQGADVQIGEGVVFDILVFAPEGTANDLVIEDQLPAGLRLDGGPGAVTLLPQAFDGTPFNGTVAISTVTLSGPADGSGDAILTIDLGDVTAASDVSLTNNFFILRIPTVVVNTAANQDGVSLENTASATFTSGAGTTIPVNELVTGDTIVNVVEPVLEIEKATTAVNIEAGDRFEYTVTLRHTPASTAGAFDLEILDTLPVQLAQGQVVSAIITGPGGSTVTGSFSFDASGRILQVDDNAVDLLLDQTLTLTISAVATNAVQPGEVLTNQATVTYTSINDLPPGVSNPDERNGTGFPDPNALNNYFATDSVDLTIQGDLSVDKRILDIDSGSFVDAPQEVTIGEVITYRVEVTLFEGTTLDVRIEDFLPAGTVFVPGSLSSTPGDFLLTNEQVSYLAGPNRLVITYDSATFNGIPADSGGGGPIDTASFTLEYQVRVRDVPGNSAGPPPTELPNAVMVSATNVPTDNDAVVVTIIEPQLTVTKSVNDLDQVVSIGETLTYTLQVAHTAGSTADAFDFVLLDPVPFLGLVNIANITATGTFGVIGLDASASVGNLIEVRADQVPLGATITITFDAEVSPTAQFLGDIDNNVRIYWDSLPDGDGNDVLGTGSPGEFDRDYGATPGYTEAPTPAPDDPAQDTERVRLGGLRIGDTVWVDQNRNGIVDPNERLLENIFVWVDQNQDGVRQLTEPGTTTDANGNYLIAGLAPGIYSVRVDPSTVPSGLREVFLFDDPILLGSPQLGSNATDILLAGSDELRADFGYFRPLVPPTEPPDPIEPRQPVGFSRPLFPTPFTPAPVFETSVAIAATNPDLPFSSFSSFSAIDTYFIDVFNPLLGGFLPVGEPFVPYTFTAGFPFLSGAAEPGSSITLAFYDSSGQLIVSNTILVASGGNWTASFPGAEVGEAVTVRAWVEANNFMPFSSDHTFNYRTNYFTGIETAYMTRGLTIGDVFSGAAFERMLTLFQAEEEMLGEGWNKDNYEFLSAPGVPSS